MHSSGSSSSDSSAFLVVRASNASTSAFRKLGSDQNFNLNEISGYIGFYFTLANNTLSERIAPAFVDVYNADWIIQP